MAKSSPRFAMLFMATIACCLTASDARSKKCKVDRYLMLGLLDLTCSEPTPYCCAAESRPPTSVFCCNDCRLSLDSDDCDNKNYWQYVGYAIGGVAVLFLLAGLVFGLVKLVKVTCCKRRSTVVRAADAAAGSQAGSTADYPRNVESVPEWQQPPKRPPEYYDVFTVSPPPAYKERPESA